MNLTTMMGQSSGGMLAAPSPTAYHISGLMDPASTTIPPFGGGSSSNGGFVMNMAQPNGGGAFQAGASHGSSISNGSSSSFMNDVGASNGSYDPFSNLTPIRPKGF